MSTQPKDLRDLAVLLGIGGLIPFIALAWLGLRDTSGSSEYQHSLVVYAASCEEQFLADSFPDAFTAYVLATPNMWWPGRGAPMPESLDVRPAVFWKAFLDAGSFFLLWVLVAVAAEFRLAG